MKKISVLFSLLLFGCGLDPVENHINDATDFCFGKGGVESIWANGTNWFARCNNGSEKYMVGIK